MKLMTFNILNGGGDEHRFRGVLDVIRRSAPDLLVLQECVGWDDGLRLAQVAEVLGIPAQPPHAALGLARARGSGQRYHLGIFSRHPWTDMQTHNDPAFLGHALVKLTLDWGGSALNLFAAHFDAKNENLRFVEARYLRSLLEGTDFRGGLYALAGDLNALSRHDPYPADLEALLRESLTTKYHLPPRFEVMDELAEFGWQDGLYLRPPTRWITAPRDRGGVHIDYRTDYLLFSPALAKRVGQVEVIALNDESDHYPVMGLLL